MYLLSIIIPTFNEAENIAKIISKISKVLQHDCYEIIVVDDDSQDGTCDVVRDLSRDNSQIRCLERLGRRGLSSACMEGVLSSSAPFVAIIDADGQHDESLLKNMLSLLMNNKADLVIGSRYMEGGSTGDLQENRVFISRTATWFSNLLLNIKVSDPMSGFFMFRQSAISPYYKQLSAHGFKILLDILVHIPVDVRVKELPYKMRNRQYGQSKLDILVTMEFFWIFLEKISGFKISRQFIAFMLVGLSGVFVHMLTLTVTLYQLNQDFWIAQLTATMVAMTSNFYLNNQFTYKQQRLTGIHFFTGLISFYVACSLGAIINNQFALLLFNASFPWWFAGISGAIVGSVWNYTMTKVLTWKS